MAKRPSGRAAIGNFRTLVMVLALGALGLLVRGDDSQQTGSAPGGPGALKNLSLDQLSQIEVTSPSKEPTPAFRSPVAIYVITGDDIRRSGVTTLPDALRLAPGVEVAQIDGSKWSVGIRGFGTRLSRDVLVLIDGRTVYTPLVAGTYWEVQDTLLEDIDRIEVIRGPGGTIWGPNAVNGVINIITKSAKDTKGTFVSAGGGDQEQGLLNYRYGGDNGNGLDYRFYAKAFDRGPEEHPDHDNFDHWAGAQGGFRMDWTGGPRDSFTLQGDGYAQEDGERVTYSTYVPPVNGVLDGYADASGGNVLFRWTRTLTDADNFQLQVFYDRTNRQEPNFGEDRDTGDIDFIERTKLSSRQELLFGAGVRFSDGRFNEAVSGLVFYPFNRLDWLASAFFEDDISLVRDKLALDLGSKLLRTNYTNGVSFQPSVRLLWTPSDRQTFWAAYTHALRTPSDSEEDFYLSSYQGTANGLPIYARFGPNPDFAPEQLNGYEAGFRQLITKRLYVDVDAFYNHYHDLFSENLAGPLFSVQTSLPFPAPAAPPVYLLIPAQFQNALYGLTKGFEISPEWRPASFWRVRGSYSFLHMNLGAQPAGLASPPSATTGASPQHEANVESSLDLGKKLQLDLTYRFVSSLPAQSVPSYSTGDARVAWRLTRRVVFSVTGRNLFQRYHVEYVGDPGPPVGIIRNVYAGLTFSSK
jgi:iron complex outermembrane receptor protein